MASPTLADASNPGPKPAPGSRDSLRGRKSVGLVLISSRCQHDKGGIGRVAEVGS